MDEMKICPRCQFANPIGATFCGRCSISLVPLLTARVTPSVPEQVLQPQPPNYDEFVAKLPLNSFLLMIAGTGKPIYFTKERTTVLGREAGDALNPRVDLTPHDAMLLGVSRKHVSIEVAKANYTVRDLESTNGTWLNGTKLVPLRQYKIESGDLLRLGQMGVYVYFQTLPVTSSNVTLSDLTASAISLTPEYLTSKIGPYLLLLAEVHDFLDTLLQRTKLMIGITKLYWDATTYQVHVDLRMDDELLQFIGVVVSRWKTQYEADIRKIWELEENTDWLKANAQHDAHTADYTALQERLYTPLAQLVQHCLTKLAPELTANEREAACKKLLPIFYRLVHSPLQLLQEPIVEYSPSA